MRMFVNTLCEINQTEKATFINKVTFKSQSTTIVAMTCCLPPAHESGPFLGGYLSIFVEAWGFETHHDHLIPRESRGDNPYNAEIFLYKKP